MSDESDELSTISDIFDTIEGLLANEANDFERASNHSRDGVRHMRTTKSTPQPSTASDMPDAASDHDRTNHIPPHTGRNIFPNHGLFSRLLRFAYSQPPRLCVRDLTTVKEATHHQLLSDVLHLRERLRSQLDPAILSKLQSQDEAIYIAVLAHGYEFTVAMLAVLALGAASVPLSTALPVEEAEYFISTSRSVAVLTASTTLRLGLALEKRIKDSSSTSTFTCIPIQPSTFTPLLLKSNIKISSDRPLPNQHDSSVVIFTSGTTGPPKGAVMRRSYTFTDALGVADHYAVTPSDVLLHVLPVHHATGLGIMFFPFLVAGALIEFRSGGFSEAWTWERWRRSCSGRAEDKLTFFSGVPTIYMRMRRYFETVIAKKSKAEMDEYIAGARSLRACLCGTSALPKPIADFWTEILGKKILLRYGATEIGAVFRVPYSLDTGALDVPDGSVGTLTPGVDVQLSTDPDSEGEVLVKSAEMFSRYLYSPSATQVAHTTEGYYRTGDIARKEGDWYWILGRASVDIIKSGGYKISALDIEREILGLDYVAEVMVVGVPDEEFGERVGAVVVMKPALGATGMKHQLTIDRLRADLRQRLAGYKMPTLLRVTMTELPKSATGKVVKKVLGPQFFPRNSRDVAEVQAWERTKGKL